MGGAAMTKYLSDLRRSTVFNLNEIALIQQDGRYSLDFIRSLRSMDEYNIYKNAGLVERRLETGERVLLPKGFNFDFVDPHTKMTNLELMSKGYNPVDANGIKYEWHHVGQKTDSPLALLTKAQHHDNHGILHPSNELSEVHTPGNEKAWTQLRKMINRTLSSAGILP